MTRRPDGCGRMQGMAVIPAMQVAFPENWFWLILDFPVKTNKDPLPDTKRDVADSVSVITASFCNLQTVYDYYS